MPPCAVRRSSVATSNAIVLSVMIPTIASISTFNTPVPSRRAEVVVTSLHHMIMVGCCVASHRHCAKRQHPIRRHIPTHRRGDGGDDEDNVVCVARRCRRAKIVVGDVERVMTLTIVSIVSMFDTTTRRHRGTTTSSLRHMVGCHVSSHRHCAKRQRLPPTSASGSCHGAPRHS